MREKCISFWKGEFVIIASGGACLRAADDQNSLLREAALHVRARTCVSTIYHRTHTHTSLEVVFLCLDLFICDNKYMLSTLRWISRKEALLYTLARENRDVPVHQHLQGAWWCFYWKHYTTRSSFLPFLLFTYWLFLFQISCFLMAVMCCPVRFQSWLKRWEVFDFLHKQITINLMTLNSREQMRGYKI